MADNPNTPSSDEENPYRDTTEPSPAEQDDKAESSEAPPKDAGPVGAGGEGAGLMDAPSTEGIEPKDKDDKTMAMLCHLLGIFTWFIGALVIWLIKKDESKFVDDQGKEALNFQISVAIVGVAFGVLSLIPFVGCVTGILSLAVWAALIVFSILGTVEANKGVPYRYPFSLRLIK